MTDKHLLQALDADQTGFLDAHNIRQALAGTTGTDHNYSTQVQNILRHVDEDNDGMIDYKDFVAMLRGTVIGFGGQHLGVTLHHLK